MNIIAMDSHLCMILDWMVIHGRKSKSNEVVSIRSRGVVKMENGRFLPVVTSGGVFSPFAPFHIKNPISA